MARPNLLLGGSAIAFVAAVAASSAQAQAQTPNSAQLEEVVVTAQRTSENAQTVPIAVATIGGVQAQKLGITDPQVIAQAVPGLTYARSAASAVPFIRGVGTPSSTIGNEPSVATFIDDVYVNNGAASFFQFNNVEQIEVLKGPQGTLFGRNATGGVIHVHTRNPTHTPTLDVTGTVANYETYGGQLYASAGLTDNIAANIAAYGMDQHKGWGRNVVTGNEVLRGWEAGARVKVLYEPTDDTSVLIAGDMEKRRHGQGIADRVRAGTFGRGGYSPDANGVGFYDATSNFDNFYTNDYRTLNAKVSHDFGPARLVSISALSRIRSIAAYDIDVSPTPFFGAMINQEGHTFTQELQLISPEDAPVKWLLGGFYLHDKARFTTLYVGSAFGAAGRAGVATGQDTDSYSGFAQATGEILPRTKLTLGVRYTSDRRKYIATDFVGPAVFVVPNQHTTFSNLTGRFALDHQFTDDLMGYVAYNRGFKSGIYNLGGQDLGSAVARPPAQPEDLNAYSAGFKSEWFDKRLRLNAEAYYYDYKNIQVATLVIGTQVITNAGAAHIKGIDVDMVALPAPNFTIRASVGLADGKYTSFPGGPENLTIPPNRVLPIPAGCFTPNGGTLPPGSPYPTSTAPLVNIACNLAGNKTVFTPKLSSNLSATYRIEGPMPIDLSASWAHKSPYFFEADNNEAVKQPTTDIFNASIQVSFADERYSLRFWGNNLSNKKYYIYITQSGTSGIKYSAAPPRTYGVTASAHF